MISAATMERKDEGSFERPVSRYLVRVRVRVSRYWLGYLVRVRVRVSR